MDIPLGTLFIILIAALCGAIGQALAGGAKGRLIPSVLMGLLGAVAGPWLAAQLNLSEPYVLHVGHESIPLVWSILGSVLFVMMLHMVSGRGFRRS